MARYLIPSDTFLKAIKPGDPRKRISDGDGLVLLLFVKPGEHGWRFDYRFAGRRNMLSFGNYPDTTLAIARRKADAARRLLAEGFDPSQQRKAERQAQVEAYEDKRRVADGLPPRGSFEEVAREWYAVRKDGYLMINTFAYGIFNQDMALPHLNDPGIQAYRHKWLEAAFAPGKIEAVVTFGTPAFNAWTAFKATPAGQSVTAFHHRALHPTADKPGGPITRKDLLDNWNVALQGFHANIQHPDVTKPLVIYGSDFAAGELPEIPSLDLPMGLQSWMRTTDFWATMSPTPGTQRANISIEVP